MSKTVQRNIDDKLKKELEHIELNSEVSKGTVVDVIYPDYKVNYNEEFEIELVVKLLDDNKEKISINCPKYKKYDESDLNILQKYAGVKIYDFADENIEIPVKYQENELVIDYEEISFQNKNNSYILTETGSDIIIIIIFLYLFVSFVHINTSVATMTLLLCISLIYWIRSQNLTSSRKLFESI